MFSVNDVKRKKWVFSSWWKISQMVFGCGRNHRVLLAKWVTSEEDELTIDGDPLLLSKIFWQVSSFRFSLLFFVSYKRHTVTNLNNSEVHGVNKRKEPRLGPQF